MKKSSAWWLILATLPACRSAGPVESAADPSVTTVRMRSTGNSPPPGWARNAAPEATDEEIFFRGSKTGAVTLEQGQVAAREEARRQAREELPAWGRTPESLARGLKEVGLYHERVDSVRGSQILSSRFDVYVLLKFDCTAFPQKEALHWRGLKELGRGNLPEAVSLLEQVLRVDPAFGPGYFSLAQAYEKSAAEVKGNDRLARQRQALDAYRQFVVLTPAAERGKVALAQVARLRSELSAGLRDEARKQAADQHYARALELLTEASASAGDPAEKEALAREYYEVGARKVLAALSPVLEKAAPGSGKIALLVRPFLAAGGTRTREGEMMRQGVMAGLLERERISLRDADDTASPGPSDAILSGQVGQQINLKLLDGRDESLLAYVNVYRVNPAGAPEPVAPPPAPKPAVPAGRPGVPATPATPAATPAPAVAPEPLRPLELETFFLAQRREGNAVQEIPLQEGMTLRSRDQFQIHFRVNQEAWVYGILFDSRGQAGLLYPALQRSAELSSSSPGTVSPGIWVVAPSRENWFWLDEQTGTETLYVVASSWRLDDLGKTLREMERAGAERTQHSHGLQGMLGAYERGVGGVSEGEPQAFVLSDGKTLERITEVVKGAGTVVRVVSFEHR